MMSDDIKLARYGKNLRSYNNRDVEGSLHVRVYEMGLVLMSDCVLNVC